MYLTSSPPHIFILVFSPRPQQYWQVRWGWGGVRNPLALSLTCNPISITISCFNWQYIVYLIKYTISNYSQIHRWIRIWTTAVHSDNDFSSVVQTVIWKRLTMEMSHHSKIHFWGISDLFWEILQKWERVRYFGIFLSFPIFILRFLLFLRRFRIFLRHFRFSKKTLKTLFTEEGGQQLLVRATFSFSCPNHLKILVLYL